MLTRLGLLFCLSAFLAGVWLATDQAAPLPQWLLKAIEAERKSPRPGVFEESTYEGKRVFESFAVTGSTRAVSTSFFPRTGRKHASLAASSRG